MRALPLQKSAAADKPIRMWTRRASEVAEFAQRFGGKESPYGVFFGVCKRARDGGGTKRDILGATALWADIDAEVNGVKTEKIIDAIGRMPPNIQPSAVVHSGGGVHCYWFLEGDYFDSAGDREKAIEGANKTLMNVMGGDACFDITRVLRLPDTYNNKRAAKRLCKVVYCAEHLRYSVDRLMADVASWKKVLHNGEWLDAKKISLVTRQTSDETAPHWFDRVIGPNGKRLAGSLEKLWRDRVRDHAPRGYIGVHEATIVTAARLVCIGDDTDKVVKKVMEYQRKAPGVDTTGWDWGAEERKIRQSIETWGEKWRVLKKQKRVIGSSEDGERRKVSSDGRAVSEHTRGKRPAAVSSQRNTVPLRDRRVDGGRSGSTRRD